MTVRQENERNNQRSQHRKKTFEKHENEQSECSDTVSIKNPESISNKLDKLLTKVSLGAESDIFDNSYFCNMDNLEIFVSELDDEQIAKFKASDQLKIASAYYIFAEFYYAMASAKLNHNDIALEYLQKALSLLQSDNENKMRFSKEIVCILLLNGEILSKCGDQNQAQKKYDEAHNLVQSIKAKRLYSKAQQDILEHLSIIHCYRNNMGLTAKYNQQCLRQTFGNNSVEKRVSIMNVIESNAHISLCLMQSDDLNRRKQGFLCYSELMRDCELYIGTNNNFTYHIIALFALEFIQNDQWTTAHELVEKLLEIGDDERNALFDRNQQEIHQVFELYVERIVLSPDEVRFAFIEIFRERLNKIMCKLHGEHVKYVNYINGKLKKRECVDENEVINIVKVLEHHICLFMDVGNEKFARFIFDDLVDKERRCLNESSRYFKHFDCNLVDKNDIDSLLSLL